MLSCQQTQNVIDGKKRIILNPSEQQRRDFETVTFAENEVYGVDILISSGEDGKVSPFSLSLSLSLMWLVALDSKTFYFCAVPTRRRKTDGLPARFDGDVSVEDEDV